MHPPSGEYYTIGHGPYAATISRLGATLHEFSCQSIPVLWGLPHQVLPIGSAGQVLAPWPNRLEDGTYVFAGTTGVVPLNEPLRHNAIHGLVRWLYWDREYLERDRVKLRCTLAPQPAYPFVISFAVMYELSDDGLVVRVEAEAEDSDGAPFGIGFHPYFLGDSAGLAHARLHVPATQRYVLNDRGLPEGEVDLREFAALRDEAGLSLKDIQLDDCFSGLDRDLAGRAVIRYFPGESGIAEVVMRLEPAYDHVMCFTGDTLPEHLRRLAVAIEPMTCPPNAFVTGDSLRILRDGEPFTTDFAIEVRLAGS